jgi:drug/metabolite transporter (DMT)-like permease
MELSQRTDTILSIISYSFCSACLVLVNKLTLHLLPYPSLIVTFQLLATVFFIYAGQFLQLVSVDPIRWMYMVPFLGYTFFFSVGMYCNMKSLENGNVETVIVFRGATPCIVALLDAMLLGHEFPSMRSWLSLLLILLGSIIYATVDPDFQSHGMKAYSWPIAYLVAMSIVLTYGKIILNIGDLKTKSGPVLYTNILGWPPLLIFAKFSGEYDRVRDEFWMRDGLRFPDGSLPLLFLGCVIGTGIGYSSWWCRDKVSATSFTLIGVMNKCLTVLLNLLIWEKHASVSSVYKYAVTEKRFSQTSNSPTTY